MRPIPNPIPSVPLAAEAETTCARPTAMNRPLPPCQTWTQYYSVYWAEWALNSKVWESHKTVRLWTVTADLQSVSLLFQCVTAAVEPFTSLYFRSLPPALWDLLQLSLSRFWTVYTATVQTHTRLSSLKISLLVGVCVWSALFSLQWQLEE